MASVGDEELGGKRRHVRTQRMAEFLRMQEAGSAGSKSRVCPVVGCQKVYTSAPGLRYHVKTHSPNAQPFHCQHCHSTFKSKNGLKYHLSKKKCSEKPADPASPKREREESWGPDPPPPLLLPRMKGKEEGGRAAEAESIRREEEEEMDPLWELAVIATGPQSPLLSKPSQEWGEGCVTLTPKIITMELSPQIDAEADPAVLPQSPPRGSLPSHSKPSKLPGLTWQCFTKDVQVQFQSLPRLGWHYTADLEAGRPSTSLKNPKLLRLFHLLCQTLRCPVGWRLLHKQVEELADQAVLTFKSDGEDQYEVVCRCPSSHPFLARDRGWLSCDPEQTATEYGLSCHLLEVGDTCLPLSHPDASVSMATQTSSQSQQLTPLASSAAIALSNMAARRRGLKAEGFAQVGKASPGPLPPTVSPQSPPQSARIKRPMNAFMLYAKMKRQEFKRKNPGRDNRAITVLLGEAWQRLGPKERRKFELEAQRRADEMRRLHPDCWKRKQAP